jgi:hypothetical protein
VPLAQLEHAAQGVEYSFGAFSELGSSHEDRDELNQLALVGAGEVVLGSLGRLVAALAAAIPGETGFAVPTIDLAPIEEGSGLVSTRNRHCEAYDSSQ